MPMSLTSLVVNKTAFLRRSVLNKDEEQTSEAGQSTFGSRRSFAEPHNTCYGVCGS
jgi:hypothetical protein